MTNIEYYDWGTGQKKRFLDIGVRVPIDVCEACNQHCGLNEDRTKATKIIRVSEKEPLEKEAKCLS